MKDKRFKTAKLLIESGQVTFLELFTIVPKTVIGNYMGMHNNSISNLIYDPTNFSLEQINKLAKLIGCDARKLWMLAGEDAVNIYRKQNIGH